MTALELLSELDALGVMLHLDRDELRYRAPAGVMTPELKQMIRERRSELINHLSRLPSEAPEQPPHKEVAPPSLSVPWTTAGVSWPAALTDWALLLQPLDLPERFTLRAGVEVINRRRFLAWLQRDLRLGPNSPRARYGALQGDLMRLRQILTPD